MDTEYGKVSLQGIREMTESYGKIVVSTLMGAALGITVTYRTGVASNRTAIAVMSSKLEVLNTTIASSMTDRYRGADAARDFGVVHQQIAAIVQKTQELETDIETHIRNGNK